MLIGSPWLSLPVAWASSADTVTIYSIVTYIQTAKPSPFANFLHSYPQPHRQLCAFYTAAAFNRLPINHHPAPRDYRTPDQAGFTHRQQRVSEGASDVEVLLDFITSQELRQQPVTETIQEKSRELWVSLPLRTFPAIAPPNVSNAAWAILAKTLGMIKSLFVPGTRG